MIFLYSTRIDVDLVRILAPFFNAVSGLFCFRPHFSSDLSCACFSTDYESSQIEVEHSDGNALDQIACAVSRYHKTVKHYHKDTKTYRKRRSTKLDTKISLYLIRLIPRNVLKESQSASSLPLALPLPFVKRRFQQTLTFRNHLRYAKAKRYLSLT